MSKAKKHGTVVVALQAPKSLVAAIDKAAASRFETRSHYVRAAVLKALAEDGCQPVAAA